MKVYNVLVLGSDSQIAKEIYNRRKKNQKLNYFFLRKKNLDIRSTKDIKKFIIKRKINILINCAAFTNVDLAEKNKKKCIDINFFAINKLAKLCKVQDIIFIHFSTDYVFNGKRKTFYNELCRTNPLNYYGYTKLLADKAILKIKPRGMIIRTSWVYSQYGNNFVKTILNLIKNKKEIKVVNDQFGTPTSAKDLATILLKIITSRNFLIITNKISIFNLSGNYKISWFKFALEIAKYVKYSKKIQPITTLEYKFKTIRPMNSSLDCSKIKRVFKIRIPNWKNSLINCLEDLI